MSRAWTIALAAAAIVLATWVYSHLERVNERVFTGYSGEAARNPLLAFERLVARMGGRASTLRDAAAFDALTRDSTLVLARGRYALTPSRAGRLLHWVESGGHLIVEAERPGDHDVLLDRLGVVRQRTGGVAGPIRLTLPGSRREYRIRSTPIALSRPHRDALVVGSGPDTALVRFEYGRGRVSVLPAFRLLHNGEIGELDHAAFAWALLVSDRAGAHAPVVFVAPGSQPPSLLGWLGQNARAALAAALVLLALWLARSARRFGPIVPQPDGSRRRLLDHLRASGRFEWSAHAAPRLLTAAREACLSNIARARPALARLDAAERTARCAELTGLPETDIELALTGAATTPRSFTLAMQTLQAIDEKLARRASA